MGNKFSLNDLESKKKKGLIKDFEVSEKGRDEKKKSKYGNRKTELDGHLFDSQKEANRYIQLRYLEKAGEIRDLRLQAEFPLEVNGEKVASYYADFCYYKGDEYVVEDSKSVATKKIAVYRLKKKLMKQCHNIIIQEV